VSKKEFLELLDKYLAGNASDDEEHFLLEVYRRMEDKYEWSLDEMNAFDQLENRLLEKFKMFIQQQNTDDKPAKNIRSIRSHLSKGLVFKVAAMLLLFLCVGIYFTRQNKINADGLFAGASLKDPVMYVNNRHVSEKIILPDGSFVDLKAGSKVIYEKGFAGSLRQIYLKGEGFFRVTKNHNKPFIVYTDRVVAKVLGTSFIVKTGLNGSETSVLVKTGKVSVFKTAEFTREDTKPNLIQGVIILPNQAASLNQTEKLEKKLASSPDILKSGLGNYFDFENTPIDTVFSRLKLTYGINILYDKVKMNSCSISVSMGKEGFYQKLNLICRTINASYEVRDGEVVVSGAGCSN
jgi:ferric-dicitrate binding protein FerR (iron transport regulator)